MMNQRQLVLVVEATGALGASWPVLLTEYVDKVVRAFCEESNGQNLAGSPGEMALVVFNSHGPHAGCLLQQSGWTSSMDIFFKWLSAISFEGGGFGEAAVAEALAEALMMCCPGPKVPLASQGLERQKHCLLIAASNPHRLPTPVIRPPVPMLLQPSGGGELQAEQWWLADAETVAKAFPTCQVTLSIIAPRQLPLLRSIFNGARRNARATEIASDASKQYPQHLVLISEGFMEGRMAVRRAAVASNAALPSGLSAKLEPLMITSSSVQSQPVAVRPSAVSTTTGSMLGRQTISNGTSSVIMDNQSLLHNNVGTAAPLQMQQHPSTSGLSGADTVQTSDNSASSQAKLVPVAANPATLGGHMNNTAAQPRQISGATTLGGGVVASGAPAGLSGTSVVNTAGAPPSLAPPSQATSVSGNGSVLTGVGSVANSVPMNPTIGQHVLGGGNLTASANSGAVTSGLLANQLGPPSAVNGLIPGGQAGVGQLPVSGAGQPQPNNPLGVIAGMGGTTGALGTAGVNTGVNNTMVATPGLPQTGQQAVQQQQQQQQPVGAPNALAPAVPGHGMTAVATPPQQTSGTLKYMKLWEGILAGQRQQKPVPICKLEGYRQTSSSEKLAADWPPTMQIVRLIAQEYMNSKDYQGKAELLVFRPLQQHGFLVQLAEKKLCAVIQLPSQTLLLASTDKPGRMIGMLFPGDMVVFKPNVSTSAQQPTGAAAPIGGGGGTAQALGQATMGGQPTMAGQPTFSPQGQQQLNNPQQTRPQIIPGGPVSLQGTGFLP